MAGVTRETSPAYASYDSAGASRFVPEVWSKKMLRNFYETTAFMECANTDYEGEIKGQGDSVVIRTTPAITIGDYEVGHAGITYQVPTSDDVVLPIDQSKYWAFRIDDVDKVATDLPLMEKFAADAGERLKISIDTECFEEVVGDADASNRGTTAGAISGNIDLGATYTTASGDNAISITSTNATDKIVDINNVLDEANIPSEDRWCVIPAWYAAKLKKGDLKQADITGDGTGVIRSGVIGMVDRTKLIQSNTLYHVTEDGGTGADVELFYILAGTKEAMTFALQLTKTEELRIPESFGTYMRGLAVYGRKVVQPTAMVEMVAING